MKVLIIEDETIAYDNLCEILAQIDPSIEVVGNTESVSQSAEWFNNHEQPDIIFMDIHLSDGSAFNIFNAVNIEVPIIFTTAYDEYALEAFRVNSIDYLLKPLDADAVKHALDKYFKLTKVDILSYLSRMTQLTPKGKYIKKLLVPEKDKLVPVAIEDISFFYTTAKDTRIYLKNGVNMAYGSTLDSIMQTLNPQNFFRANKQFILSRESITNLTVWFDSRLLVSVDVDTPERIYVSKNRAADFKKWMTES